MTASINVLQRLGAVVEELQSVHFQVPEDDVAVARGALFAPRLVQSAGGRPSTCSTPSGPHYERAAEPHEEVRAGRLLDDIGHLISSEIAGQEVTDLVFLARADLRGALQDLIATSTAGTSCASPAAATPACARSSAR